MFRPVSMLVECLRHPCLAAALVVFPLLHTPSQATADEGILDRQRAADVRVVTWNTFNEFRPDGGPDYVERLPRFARVLQAIDPDVIVFQEIGTGSTVAALPEWLSANVQPGTWHVLEGEETGIRNVIASRYPLQLQRTDTTPVSSTRGVTMALVDCPNTTGMTDLYLLAVHMKAREDPESEAKRQRHCDAIANWLGDARTPGDVFDELPQDTPMVVVGDMNFYSEGGQPEVTLKTGDIQDERTFGPDIKGDWDNSDLADPLPVDLITGEDWTLWEWESRTDRFIYTDSVVDLGSTFILNTMTLSQDVLDEYGLVDTDTTEDMTSDHLPVVVDFRPLLECTGDINGDLTVNIEDFTEFLVQFGQTGVGLSADLDGDLDVDIEDFSILIVQWGQVCETDSLGACCYEDVCDVATASECDDLEGTYLGDDSACTSEACVEPQPVWLNELHYDNGGSDTGEFLEIYASDGVDPATVQVYLYNGAGGMVYGGPWSLSSDFVTGDDVGLGSLYYRNHSGIQNGPDGIAILIDGEVAQFVSYEGTFTASDGPLAGLSSTPIPVSENSSNAPGSSIGLSGSGTGYEDFSWMSFTADSRGSLNAGQSLGP